MAADRKGRADCGTGCTHRDGRHGKRPGAHRTGPRAGRLAARPGPGTCAGTRPSAPIRCTSSQRRSWSDSSPAWARRWRRARGSRSMDRSAIAAGSRPTATNGTSMQPELRDPASGIRDLNGCGHSPQHRDSTWSQIERCRPPPATGLAAPVKAQGGRTAGMGRRRRRRRIPAPGVIRSPSRRHTGQQPELEFRPATIAGETVSRPRALIKLTADGRCAPSVLVSAAAGHTRHRSRRTDRGSGRMHATADRARPTRRRHDHRRPVVEGQSTRSARPAATHGASAPAGAVSCPSSAVKPRRPRVLRSLALMGCHPVVVHSTAWPGAACPGSPPACAGVRPGTRTPDLAPSRRRRRGTSSTRFILLLFLPLGPCAPVPSATWPRP